MAIFRELFSTFTPPPPTFEADLDSLIKELRASLDLKPSQEESFSCQFNTVIKTAFNDHMLDTEKLDQQLLLDTPRIADANYTLIALNNIDRIDKTITLQSEEVRDNAEEPRYLSLFHKLETTPIKDSNEKMVNAVRFLLTQHAAAALGIESVKFYDICKSHIESMRREIIEKNYTIKISRDAANKIDKVAFVAIFTTEYSQRSPSPSSAVQSTADGAAKAPTYLTECSVKYEIIPDKNGDPVIIHPAAYFRQIR